MSASSTRQRIVEVADRLFYEQGFEPTSFAHIAEAVGISRGNFYHHFKSKDEILDAVIALRLARTQAMVEDWGHAGTTPRDRIRSFIDIMIVNRAKIMRFGCPVGSLCAELGRLGHPAHADANRLLEVFRAWLRLQLERLGCRVRADRLALHLLARSQGIATLAAAFHDESFIMHEVDELYLWLDALQASPGSALRPASRKSPARKARGLHST